MSKIEDFIKKIKKHPETIEFDEVIRIIEDGYNYTPTRFINGTKNEAVVNEAGTNEGSCKIFSFAKIHKLDAEQTLNCFGTYYRNDVLNHPENDDHANIRTFIKYGWEHIYFDGSALKAI